MSKLIKAVFTGRFCKTQRVFQWDTDDKLQFVNVDLPANYTVDFSNSKTGDSVSVLATSDTVQIPPDLFVPGSEIYAWIWLSDSNGGHTRCEATIPIDPRARRTGTEPTPAQASAWDEAVDTLNETIEGIPDVVDAALTEAKESGEFDGADGADGNGVWYVDVQYTRTIGAGVQAQLDHMVGRTGATPAARDLCVVSDGRFGVINSITPRVAVVPVLGDLSGASAYEIAVKHGYTGTEAEWLESLQGEDGFAPEVTIETIEGGHRVTITSAAHPEGQSFDVMDGSGGGGTSDYNALSNKPQIGGVTLSGNKSLSDLGIAPAGAYVKPVGGIPASDLAAGVIPTVPTKVSDLTNDSGFVDASGAASAAPVQSVNGKTGTVVLAASDVGAGTYSKPSGGIPKSDLASAVQTSLGKANTALQSFTETDPTVPSWAKASNKPSYTASEVGAVAVAQGVAHAGEFVVVGSDGNITTVSVPSAQGVSF